MNGYKMMADSWRKLLDSGKISDDKIPETKRAVEIYDFLATCNTDDLCRMVNSSAFNDIIIAYIKLAVNKAAIDDHARENVMDQIYQVIQLRANDVLRLQDDITRSRYRYMTAHEQDLYNAGREIGRQEYQAAVQAGRMEFRQDAIKRLLESMDPATVSDLLQIPLDDVMHVKNDIDNGE